jgi:hypothetical protein
MSNCERDLKNALLDREEAEDRLARLEKMRSRVYLNNELYESLKKDYSIIKNRSEFLTANIEDLKSRQLINQDQYEILKDEYALITKSATNLLANKTEAHISEDQYNEFKAEYTKKQSDALMSIGAIKTAIKKSLDNAENELELYNKNFDKIVIRFKVGEMGQDEYSKFQRQYQNRIEKSNESVAELKRLVEAESSEDVIRSAQSKPFQALSTPLSTFSFSNNIPKSIPSFGISGGFRHRISNMSEKFWGLSPLGKIVTGLVTLSFLAIIWIMFWSWVTAQFALKAASSGSSSFGSIIVIGYAIAYIGFIIIEIIGIIMTIYGIKELWRERSEVKLI